MRTAIPPDVEPRAPVKRVKLRHLIGAGDKIMLFTLPFLIAALIPNAVFPSLFDFGEPSSALRAVSIAVLIVGVTIWLWSVALILRDGGSSAGSARRHGGDGHEVRRDRRAADERARDQDL